MSTTVERLAEFAVKLDFDQLPEEVAHESKRVLLDSIGCALAGLSVDKGEIAVRLAKEMGGPAEARIIGRGSKVSTFAAAFANGELINALDYDAGITPPGHVPPNVIPASLALGEKEASSGKSLICALAVAHEVSARFGSAMAYSRDIEPGQRAHFPPVSGYSSTIFGGTLSAGMLLKLDIEKMAHALGLAGHIAPAQSQTKWARALPATSTKYLMAGWISQAEVLAALLAEHGATGDIEVLDGDYGFWRYMGSAKWNPEVLTDKLGDRWQMLSTAIYKPYPCCRATHTALDCLFHVMEENQLQPEEIEEVKVYCDSFCADLPLWRNKKIKSSLDAQFSVPYAISVAVHQVKIGPEWQDLDTINDERIITFMDKVSVWPHPEYERSLIEDPGSRIGKVEIIARGRTFSEERRYRKGSPATQGTRMTDRELVDKFRHNAVRALPSANIEKLPDKILRLEDMDDMSEVTQMW